METVITAMLWIHVLAGTLALFVAPGALLTVKGGPAHRRWGKIYFWAMAVVAVTALMVGLWRSRFFLMLVAVFSFYAALSGYRVLYRKRPERGQRATALDWTASLLTLGAGAALVAMGILKPTPAWREIGTVAVVFGLLSLVLAGRDVVAFLKPPADRNAWWYQHMGNMMGSYIAAVTAFSVVNFGFLPVTVKWLWPTVVGTPLIALWITYCRIRFNRVKAAAQPA
jgi:uncharacterized membrane protein